MAAATKATNAPSHANRGPASRANVPTTPWRPRWPSAYSAMMSGRLQATRNTSHATRNAPAPSGPALEAAMRGKRQMLPVPTAMPSTLRTSAHRDENRSWAAAT